VAVRRIKVSSIASSKKEARFVRNARKETSLFPILDRSKFDLIRRSLKCRGAVSFQSMTEVEFVILVSCEKGMKRLAGRRRTIGETFVEKDTGYWEPS